jgi:hypothetical protein
MTLAMVNFQTALSHRYYRERDVVFVELHGDLELATVQMLFAITDAIEKEYGYALVVFDARDGLSVSPQARRFIGEQNRLRTRPAATIIIGASFALRTLAVLLQHASRVFGKQPAPLLFCSTPEELPPIQESQRQSFAAKKK